VTNSGRFALVSEFSRPGDECCIFLGMVTPFVIRPVVGQSDNIAKYRHLVGESYIHGVMGGELVEALDNGGIEKQEITLV